MRSSLVVLSLLAACGDDGVNHLADAPPANGSDAADAPPDGPPAPVTIAIDNHGAPVAGAKVYFQAPDSSEISTTTTDATGTASALMPHGGFVTAIDPYPQIVTTTAIDPSFPHVLKTFANVKPGDHLVLHNGDQIHNPPITNLTVKFPIDPAAPRYYDIYTDCGSGDGFYDAMPPPPPSAKRAGAPTTASTAMQLVGCAAATANFVIITWDDISNLPLNYAVMPSVAVSEGATINLTSAAYAGVTGADFEYKNATNISSVRGYVEYVGAGGITPTGWDDTYFDVAIDAGAGTGHTGLPTIPNTTMVEYVAPATLAGGGNHELYRWGATPDGTGKYTFDFAVNQPLLDFDTATAAPTFDQATHTASWATLPGATPDLAYARIYFNREMPDGSGGTTFLGDWVWEIASAYAAPAIALPTLVADAADFNPTTLDGITLDTVLLAKFPAGGLDLVRPHIFDLIDWQAEANTDLGGFVLGTTGHFELNTWQGGAEKRAPSPVRVLHDVQRIVAGRHADMMRSDAHLRPRSEPRDRRHRLR